jgi:hypothetical protein
MGAYSNRVIADGASYYWRLGESSGLTAVAAVGGANGTISGGVTLGQPGAIADGSTAMLFDGVDDKIVAAGAALPLVCTIEAWIKIVDNAISRPIVCGTNESPRFSVEPSLKLGLFDNANTVGPGGVRVLTTGRWYHVACVMTASAITLYVDGSVDVTVAVTRTTAAPAGVQIGHDALFGPDQRGFWLGSLDDVAIYPRALTAAEVAAHYAIGRTTEVGAQGPYADKVISDGASNYWRLNEASGTTARDSVGAKDGTISGGVTLGQPSPLQDGTSAMTFNGTGRVLTVANVAQPLATTMEAWFKTVPNGAFQAICSTRNPDGNAAAIFLGVRSTGNLCAYNGGSGANLDGIRMVADGLWHHVTAVFAGGTTASLYVDGVLDNTGNFSRTALTGLPVSIGSDAATFFFVGALDEVAIYPRALSASEVAAHYALSTVPEPRDLNTGLYTYLLGVFGLSAATSYAERVKADGATNHWRLGETAGTTAVDAIGGANGTISGGVTLNQPSAMADGNGAMLFPGTDTGKITTPLSAVSNGAAAWTWELWARLDSLTPSPSGFRMMLALGDAANYFGFNSGTNEWYTSTFIAGAQRVSLIAGVDTAWHHFVITYNGAVFVLYKDGVAGNGTPIVGTLTNTGALVIGNYAGANFGWPGAIDDVSIYPRALTAAEVSAHFTLGRSGLSGGNDLTTLITRYLATLTGDMTARWKQMEKNAGF